jgi:hypothetical protein
MIQKSIKKIVITGVIISVVFFMSYQFLLMSEQPDVTNKVKQITEANGQRTASGNKIGCPIQFAYSSIMDAGGFMTIDTIYKDTPKLILGQRISGETAGLYNFVLKPGSTGYITLVYEFADITQTVLSNYSNFYDFIGPQRISKLSEFPNDYSSSRIILKISDIKNLDEHSIAVTFSVAADISADEGPYLMRLWQTCPGEVLTVGTKPHTGPFPWDKA